MNKIAYLVFTYLPKNLLLLLNVSSFFTSGYDNEGNLKLKCSSKTFHCHHIYKDFFL